MVYHMLPTLIVTLILVIVSILTIRHFQKALTPQTPKNPDQVDIKTSLPKPAIIQRLASALPPDIFIQRGGTTFRQLLKGHWAQQECEVVPACILRPRDAQQLSTIITIIKQEQDTSESQKYVREGLFAIRSGGHSPVPGAASIQNGVLVDLGLICEVTPSEDRTSVVIGTGAKWIDVSKVLDSINLAIVRGRNSAVGVGGLTLGGGISFFSPRFGLVCSNIISYKIVLASGSIVTASASSNADLWKALKGGSNNFGVVTRFTARCFPSSKIWSGFIYLPAFQTNKVLKAFQQFVDRANAHSSDPTIAYDKYAAGPIACFSYIQAIRTQVISVNLVYTNSLDDHKKWPSCWQSSSFASLWRIWSTCTVRTLTSATDEMNTLNPPGRRQVFGTVTIRNDKATIAAAHSSYCDAFASIRPNNIKGLVFTLVLQPLLPEWASVGDPNPLGLDNTNEPLVIVSFTVNWDKRDDDKLVKATTRRAVQQIEAYAAAHGTGHGYRNLNYCQEWQRPFEGYGEENLRFLQGVSQKYDPDRLFQRGCVGGFKLDIA